MNYLKHIFCKLFSRRPVSASNTVRGRRAAPEVVSAEDFSPEVVVREIRRRMFLLLRDESHEIDFKELCAGLQRMQPLLKGAESGPFAVADEEALAEAEREAGLI